MVIVFLSILALLVFCTAQVCIFHLGYSAAATTRQQLSDLAESAVNEALGRVMANTGYGTAPFPTLTLSQGSAQAELSFNPGQSDVPVSLNNLASTNAAVASNGRIVPANCLYLVGRATLGWEKSTLEVLYYTPPYPKALSCSGPLSASGATISALSATGQSIPGSILSNCVASNAVTLQSCNITGDVNAVGQASIDSSTAVGGEVYSGCSPQPIPTLDVAGRINNLSSVPGTVPIPAGSVGSQTINWYAGCAGSLTVNGNLALNNGVLWVQGDLTVTGGISGQGVIFCSGNVQVQQGCSFDAQNAVALAANGNVTFTGLDQSSYFFQGLVYTNGCFSATSLTVEGSVVCGGTGTTATTGGLVLQNANVIGNSTGFPPTTLPLYVSATGPFVPSATGPPAGALYAFTVQVNPASPYFSTHPAIHDSTPLQSCWVNTVASMTLVNVSTGAVVGSWSNVGWDAPDQADGLQVAIRNLSLGLPNLVTQVDFFFEYAAPPGTWTDVGGGGGSHDPNGALTSLCYGFQPMNSLLTINSLYPIAGSARVLLWHFD